MRKLDESFTSVVKDMDECVKISSIRTKPIENANEVNKFDKSGHSKSFILSTEFLSTSDGIRSEKLGLRSVGSSTNIGFDKSKLSIKLFDRALPRTPLEQLSVLNQTIISNNLHAHSKVQGRYHRGNSNDADEDLNDEDTADTLALRNNLNARILTEGKSGLFNDKIEQFNNDKNKSFCNGNTSMTSNRPTVREFQMASYRMTTEGMPQGPKNYFTTELHSPKPKDNSLDDINDILFDDLSHDEGSNSRDLDETAKIPAKDYIEITEAFERNELRNPMAGDTTMSPDHRLFSRGNEEEENGDYIDLLANDEVTHVTNMNENIKHVRLMSMEDRPATTRDPMEAITKAIFEHSVDTVVRLLKTYPEVVNQQDSLGNTPLMLATKLSYKHLDYFPIVKTLLAHGADPKIKDPNGWSCLDEVVCQSDVMLLSVLFDNLTSLKKKKLAKQQEKLMNILKLTPDFYLEMKWDFESSIIPFFSRLAPSDTFKIWKYDKYLRMDSTLAGFKRLSIKRRDMSLIFNPDVKMPDNYKAAACLFNVNRTKKQFTNPLQDVDIEEKKYMMYDMLKADPLQGTFNIKGCNWQENKGFFGNNSNQKVGDWDSRRFDFKLDMEYAVFKKSKTFFKDTYENYKTKVMNAKAMPAQKVFNKDAREILTQLKQRNGFKSPTSAKSSKFFASPKQDDKKQPPKDPQDKQYLKIDTVNLDTFENASVTEKKQEASIWLAKNFPMKFDTLLPVVKFLSNGNNLLQRVESLLSRDEVKGLISENAFPVKIQVPITLSIKANVTITKYELIQNPNVRELFFIPEGYKYIDRKEAQKTLQRTKKRMVLVNVLT
jgi:hypothetical protein